MLCCIHHRTFWPVKFKFTHVTNNNLQCVTTHISITAILSDCCYRNHSRLFAVWGFRALPPLVTTLVTLCVTLSRLFEKPKERLNYLRIPPLEKLTYKCRSFRYAAPVVWNKLPRSIRESYCIDTFKIRLKTFYFKKWLAD